MQSKITWAVLAAILIAAGGYATWHVLGNDADPSRSDQVSREQANGSEPESSSEVAGNVVLVTQQDIDTFVARIDAQIESGALQVQEKELGYSEPYVPVKKSLVLDEASKQPVRYEQTAGSDDSSVTAHFYYADGALRYARFDGGAINGSILKHAIHFRADGTRMAETHVYTEGPGYTFPEVWPEDELVRDPVAAFER